MIDEKKELDEVKQLFPNYPNLDTSVYLNLLPQMLRESRKENYTEFSQQKVYARTHAFKLTIVFGTVDHAMTYLQNFKVAQPHAKQPVHDACLFVLPDKEVDWNIPLWRAIILRENPSSPNHPLMRMLSFVPKIQTRSEDKSYREQSVRHMVEESFRQKYAKQFDDTSDKTSYMNSELIRNKKIMNKETEKEFIDAIKINLNFSLGEQLSEQQRKLFNQQRELATELYDQIKERIHQKYCKKIEEKYDSLNKFRMLSKAEYIESQLKINKGVIDATVRTQSVALNSQISFETLQNYASNICYERANENLPAASLFFQWGIPEAAFNQYLSLIPKDNETFIPNVTIQGIEICEAYKQYTLEKLNPANPEAAILGKLTGCCQSLGFEGSACVIHGITDERGGFYVLRDKNGTIVSQCWAVRAHNDDNILFDSVETQFNFRKHQHVIIDFYTLLAKKLVDKHNVPCVKVGIAGETPKALGRLCPNNESVLYDYSGYNDASRQRIIAHGKIPLVELYDPINQAILDSIDDLKTKFSFVCERINYKLKLKFNIKTPFLDKASIQVLCDLCVLNNIKLESLIDLKPSLQALGLPDSFVSERIELTRQWRLECDELPKQKKLSDITTLIDSYFEKDKDFNINILSLNGCNAIGYVHKIANLLKVDAFELITFLVNRKADVTAKDSYGSTALHNAARYGDLASVKYLLENKALINAKNIEKQTPLHVAVIWEKKEVIYFLINNKANLNIIDSQGRNILTLLCEYPNDPGITQLILDKGAPVDISILNAALIRKSNILPIILTHFIEKNPNYDLSSIAWTIQRYDDATIRAIFSTSSIFGPDPLTIRSTLEKLMKHELEIAQLMKPNEVATFQM